MARLTISDLEIERNDDPFEIEMNDGEVFALLDPKGVAAEKLIVLEKLPPAEQVKAIVAGDRADELLAYPDVDGYFLEALLQKYAKHFGLGNLGNASASPRSLNGTARQSRPTSRAKR